MGSCCGKKEDVHQKDVNASGTPKVKASTSAGVEVVMGAAARFKANVRDAKMKSKGKVVLKELNSVSAQCFSEKMT